MRFFLSILLVATLTAPAFSQHEFNGPYRGRNLDMIGFPVGGIGAGMYCLEGNGAISRVSVRHQMDFHNAPCCFAAVRVEKDKDSSDVRLLEGPIADWKYFNYREGGRGGGGSSHGLPRFKEAEFQTRFPFATVDLKDANFPVDVQLLGWSPFTPPDADSSSTPTGAIEYRLTNKTDKPIKAIFSFSSVNFMRRDGSIGPVDGGFVLYDRNGRDKNRDTHGGFAFFVDGEKPVVDHCWFRGGWWDPFTIAWDNVEKGRMIDNPPCDDWNAPGATLSIPFELPAKDEKTFRLLTCWYVPESSIRIGRGPGDAFRHGPARGAARDQQRIKGFLGHGLVNTYAPGGDAQTGMLTSRSFKVEWKNVHFLLGGGDKCAAQLLIDDKIVRSASGRCDETLEWTSWDVAEFKGKQAVFRIVDKETGGWGHINLDHIVFSDLPIAQLRTADADSNALVEPGDKYVVFEDFEGPRFERWSTETDKKDFADTSGDAAAGLVTTGPSAANVPHAKPTEEVPSAYTAWYVRRFESVKDVSDYWRKNYADLKKRSQTFTNAFYDSTLPPEVLEAVAANLTIMKTPTVLRQHDGRMWCWEGCADNGGSCEGTCTHVWNYAQAFPHLFPVLERSLRQTEYGESSSEGTGRQAFRANLPIAPGGTAFDAADGQLGGIMKVYREWRITNNPGWLKVYWPLVRRSLDYEIRMYDPQHTGLLIESHHNTYDINYHGPDGHCGSFYLGALAAAVEMGTALGDDVTLYKELLEKGKKYMKDELYNGEYFIQIVKKDAFNPVAPKDQGPGYAEIVEKVNEQGPKYQYGTGCLSDGVLGFWMAKCCGLDAPIIEDELVLNHLLSVYKYNMRRSLEEHANPQRPGYALGTDGGLLLCSWPHGGKPLIPFVYSDEVWTGIEYQVAAHLMMLGRPDEGLDIVRVLRNRYDGVRRNPFNEYEWGHWYARALASYAMLQGLTGVRYDAPDKTLYVDSKVGDFRSFLCTETGFGVVELKEGTAKLDVRSGTIDVEKIVVK